MQKIKNSILSKMIERKLTSKEIDFLLYISRFQDEYGKVYGIHYKEVCEEMHMSYQGFYDVKESLVKKGFIRSEKTNRIDHDITILDNVFLSKEDCHTGYISTNHSIFFCQEFYKLKAGAKLLAMKLIEIIFSGRKKYFEIRVKKFYDREEGYPARFGVTERVMRSWLMSLKFLFSIRINDGKYIIEPKETVFKNAEAPTEIERLRWHYIDAILRRQRIKDADKEEKRDVYKLLKQYNSTAAKLKKNLFELFGRAVEKSLKLLNESEKRIKKRIIKIKLIHKLLREDLIKEGWNPDSKTENLEKSPTDNVQKKYDQKGKTKGKNKFHNFEQRKYDYDELERYLLNTNPARA